jgi:hypothetical protein
LVITPPTITPVFVADLSVPELVAAGERLVDERVVVALAIERTSA